MKTLSVVTIALVSFLVIGCGSSVPSSNDAKNALLERITSQSSGRIKLSNFNKTDGQLQERAISFYVLEFEAEIEFLEECWSLQEHYFVLNSSFYATGFRTKESTWKPGFWDGPTFWVRRNKGESITITGEVTFEKKESGWLFKELDSK